MANRTKCGKQLAVRLMTTLKMKPELIKAFKKGEVYKTLSGNQNFGSISSINSKDEMKVITELEEEGFIVYHVLSSSLVVDGLKMKSVSYLFVPNDIFAAFDLTDEDVKNDRERNANIRTL